MSDLNKTQIGGNHYTSKAVQPWEAMQAWMSHQEFTGFLRGNVIKYIARCNDKGGIEDLKKARHYLDKLIAVIESEKNRVESMTYSDFRDDLIKMLGEFSPSVKNITTCSDPWYVDMVVDYDWLQGDAVKNYVNFVCGVLQLKYPHEEPIFFYSDHKVKEQGYYSYGDKLATVCVEIGLCK